MPLLTPLRTGEKDVFPSIGNLRLHAAFLLKKDAEAASEYLEKSGIVTDETKELPTISIVQIPASISRIVWLPDNGERRLFTLLDDVVRTFGQCLFPGFSVEETLLFKVTRDADSAVDEDRDDDFIEAIQEILSARLSSFPVRMICTGNSPTILSYLKTGMDLTEAEIYQVPPPIDFSTLNELVNSEGLDRLRYPVWEHYWPVDFPSDTPLWDTLDCTDLLLHVPYQKYDPVIRFINDAADDPSVLAIKITLYRTSGDSPIIRTLERAARSGKHVTVFVELKARFDEERNISWAYRLEKAGVIVVYGIAKIKVHAKLLLVVRRKAGGISRYVYLSTGNFNDKTARLYVDMSLFTTNEDITNDATLFSI
nr:hypothetical protein [Brucepastera parasyntrophica]